MGRRKPMPTTIDQASPWLQGRTFASWREEFDSSGYLIFERVLSQDRVAGIRAALAPYLERDLTGRNDFEGLKTNRVYALLAKSPLFAELAIHLQPGETVQPWHFDDGGVRLPRPRPAFGLSAFWAIDDTTELNGSTEVIPGSHLWNEQAVEGAVKPADFTNKAAPDADRDFGNRPDAVKITMPSGSLAVAKGTLWHRGGANLSDRQCLIITPQYCAGWVRQLENMSLAVPTELAEKLPERARELIGYSIHPPFMGPVDSDNPKRLLQAHAPFCGREKHSRPHPDASARVLQRKLHAVI